MATMNYELAATVLIEALFTTDGEACVKYGITARTLRRYRQRLAKDQNLAQLVKEKKAALDAGWASELPGLLRESQQAIKGLIAEIRTNPILRKNPMLLVTALEKSAGAHRLFVDAYYTGKMIDARIAATTAGSQNELRGEGVSDAAPVPDYSN
jgi:hypothetical protein